MRMNVCDTYAISDATGDISDQYFEKLEEENLVHLMHGVLNLDVA